MCSYPGHEKVTAHGLYYLHTKKKPTEKYKSCQLKEHYDELIFSWCQFLNKWFKIIFLYPYGKISLPFLNKKTKKRRFQQKSQRDSWTDCQATLSCLITDPPRAVTFSWWGDCLPH